MLFLDIAIALSCQVQLDQLRVEYANVGEISVEPRRRENVAAIDSLWIHANGTNYEYRAGRGLIVQYTARGPRSAELLARAEKVARACIDAAPRPAWMTRCQLALNASVDDNSVYLRNLRIRERGKEPDSPTWTEIKPHRWMRTTDELVAIVDGPAPLDVDRCLDP
jgi:hypothetical protein